MERDSESLIIQATQIKTHDVISPTAQNGHPPKDFRKIKCYTRLWEHGILPHCRRDVGRKTARRFLNTLNIELPHDFPSPRLGLDPQKIII